MHNPKLADMKGLSKASRKAIDNLHVERDLLREDIDRLGTSIGKSDMLELINYTLQDLWGFSRNAGKHTADDRGRYV